MAGISDWNKFGDANINPCLNWGIANSMMFRYRNIDNRKFDSTKSVFLKVLYPQYNDTHPCIITSRIYSLPSEKYELKAPIDVVIKIFDNESIAVFPDLELYGEWKNETEALSDLKLEILDLLDDMEDVPDNELGQAPKAWKKTLNLLVVRCQ
jgi:hypothetical protein